MAVEAVFTPGVDEEVVLKDGANSQAVQAVVLVSPLGIPYAASGGGGGGAGDASADNQTAQIALETAIRDHVTAFVPGATASHPCSTTALSAQACTAGAQLRFSSEAGAIIAVAFGNSTIASTVTFATAMTVTAPETFTVPPGATHWSAVMASGTGTLKCTAGTGA